MKKLNFCNTDVTNELAWPETEREVTVESPAFEVFTDFTEVTPLVIDADTNAIDAEKLMRKAHVRLKVVVDKLGHFLGIVSLQDLNSQEVIIKISNGENREDLSVVDFMQPRNRLRGLAYADVAKSSVRNIVDTLQHSNQQHCVVLDRDGRRVRGIISSSDLVRKLRLPLDVLNDSSFSAVYRALRL